MNELEAFLARRNKALETLDMDYAREMFPQALCDDVLLIALHKARLECTAIPDKLRYESKEWLQSRGMKRAYGLPFEEGLPE